jgi:transposase-like protein
MKTQTFAIEQIVMLAECQARASISHDAVAEYADAIDALPPVDVFLVVGVPHLVDGFHRLAAHHKAGKSFVRCAIVGTGTLAEAGWCAVKANRGHGLRRTNEDKRKAVRMALESSIGAEQSSRVIAEHVGVSDMLVGEVRRQVEADTRRQVQDSCTSTPEPTRKGKDGKSYPTTKPKREKVAPAPAPVEAAPVQKVEPAPKAAPVVETAEPMPPTGAVLTECADILREARMRIRKILPAPILEKYDGPLKSAETAMRCDVPVVCEACGGAGCRPCQRRGWVLTLQLGKVPRA